MKIPHVSKTKSESMDDCCACAQTCKRTRQVGSPAGPVYGLGLIGALIYYISTATGFWMGALGVLKAIVWPAFVVYELMKYLQL